MRIIRDLESCPPEYRGAALALGNFDGVHLGHRAILRACTDIAKAENILPAVMTFEPHPREFFARKKIIPPPVGGRLGGGHTGSESQVSPPPDPPPNGEGEKHLRIYPFRRKMELLRDCGIEAVFIVRFGQRFAAHSAHNFVGDILHRGLGVRHVVTGYNFAFGKGRQGNVDFMREQAQNLGFGFTACARVHDASGGDVSSSIIRTLLSEGNVAAASTLLGAPYSIGGHVRHGEKRGRLLGFPTANIPLGSLFRPRFGVYAARLKLASGESFGAVANIGVKPTFGRSEPLLEAHGFAMDKNLYGQYVDVQLIEFIRDEKRFDGIDALKSQIAADCAHAKRILTA